MTQRHQYLEYCDHNEGLLNDFLKMGTGQFISEDLFGYLNEERLTVVSGHMEGIQPLLSILILNF